ncbi:YihY/virulence factor BrkB family protein [Rickettsiales endosymbiont of Stachyamoeba lipophora]|uniref:YihY/virulence factor BrkB family protein n=1 Tax=Rickettsiales endosymbiont of Stachyamoeba lipophora TaxID=2486578 RepID=UPI000F646BD8|nr:YihY/virulence factor BrkB family protein [Rickettsiales endosymbiont of Stachyamoeba lipophora]AZL15572.1 YihY/virulence factor BrkB family protein [Rickettsiales endosymbiont of Stachyamoeba lipophora]
MAIKRSIIKNFFKTFWKAIADLIKHDGIEHAGYMSFVTILSLFPFLIIFITLAGEIGQLPVVDNFIKAFLNNLPDYVAEALKPRIQEIISGPPHSIVTIAILGALWTASSAIEGLRTILNKAYRVSSPPPYLLRRLLSIMQFLIMIFLLIFILVIILVLPPIALKILSIAGLDHSLLEFNLANLAIVKNISLFMVLLVFVTSLNYFVTNLKLTFKELVPGCILVVAGWIIAGQLFSSYLRSFNQVNLIYGSLEGIIITLLFFYIINIIFIFGAEFNYHFKAKKQF